MPTKTKAVNQNQFTRYRFINKRVVKTFLNNLNFKVHLFIVFNESMKTGIVMLKANHKQKCKGKIIKIYFKLAFVLLVRCLVALKEYFIFAFFIFIRMHEQNNSFLKFDT